MIFEYLKTLLHEIFSSTAFEYSIQLSVNCISCQNFILKFLLSIAKEFIFEISSQSNLIILRASLELHSICAFLES